MWFLTEQQAVGIKPGRPAAAILPITGPDLANTPIIPSATEITPAGPGRIAVSLTMEFPSPEKKDSALQHFVDHGLEVEILFATRHKP
jgi:hypothetical protein